MKQGKNYKKALEGFDKNKTYTIEEALEIMEKLPKAKFDESVEVHFRLSIDAKKGDQQIRFALTLPNGTGKTKKVAAFTENSQEEAKKAGADVVGGEDLIEKVKAGKVEDFEVAVATPEMMPKLAKVARILGPKGLMPNPKNGTVGPKIGEIIKELKQGRLDVKNDKTGNLHQVIGKVSFGKEKLVENFKKLVEEIEKNKPKTSKGKLLKKIVLSTTMGPGIVVSN